MHRRTPLAIASAFWEDAYHRHHHLVSPFRLPFCLPACDNNTLPACLHFYHLFLGLPAWEDLPPTCISTDGPTGTRFSFHTVSCRSRLFRLVFTWNYYTSLPATVGSFLILFTTCLHRLYRLEIPHLLMPFPLPVLEYWVTPASHLPAVSGSLSVSGFPHLGTVEFSPPLPFSAVAYQYLPTLPAACLPALLPPPAAACLGI